MNTAHKGRRAEWKAQRILEAAGYTVTRAAASKGVADLIAFNAIGFRLISVKCGTKYASAIEKEAMRACAVPPNATREVWRFPDYAREPLIEVL